MKWKEKTCIARLAFGRLSVKDSFLVFGDIRSGLALTFLVLSAMIRARPRHQRSIDAFFAANQLLTRICN